ncbi:MAG: DUF6320 domain-containing protein [Oscillospiraceae bacterium]|nr:DUF6320 domain-containing protein [Oscillospiraceae bacterium]
MSYCVNCGVELGDAEKQCPLCGVVVINPAKPWKEPDKRPYPEHIDEVIKSIDLKYVVCLVALIMLIPCAVSLLCNLTIEGSLSWSLYVLGACVCLFVWVLLPLLFKKPKPYLFVMFNGLVTAAYLFLIAYMTDGIEWLVSLCLPLLGALTVISLIIAYVIRRKRLALLTKISLIELLSGFLAVAIEVILDLFILHELWLNWSPIVFIVFFFFSIIFEVLRRRKKWLDEIRRRLFI